MSYAFPLLSPDPGEPEEAPIPRADWMEWLDDLVIEGRLRVHGVHVPRPESLRFIGAGYDPFEDLLDLVFQDGRTQLRFLVESPVSIVATAQPVTALEIGGRRTRVRVEVVGTGRRSESAPG